MTNRSTAIADPCQPYRAHLQQIFRAGLARVDPYQAIRRHVRLAGSQLLVTTEEQSLRLDLDQFRRVILLGAGKATAPMARAFEDLLGARLDAGFICVKEGHSEPLQRIELVEASHPTPDARGVEAAQKIIEMATAADERTLVINCLSGGGSALLPCPLNDPRQGLSISLSDKQETTNQLLCCAASIREINCVRKHLSVIKGGRLLQHLAPARSLNFILSDVVGDDLSSIASGMTSADPTTFADALAIIGKYHLRARIPARVLQALERGASGQLPETLKPGDAALELTDNMIIGSNRQALLAAGQQATELGYQTRMIAAQMEGEARQVARTMADIARDVAVSDMFVKKPACLLFGGETVVTIKGQGKGGRNQEMALAFLQQMSQWSPYQQQAVSFLAASTDGNDGPTDAAGAFADAAILRQTKDPLEMERALSDNDSYHFFERHRALLKTGPTNTNVCDVQIILIH